MARETFGVAGQGGGLTPGGLVMSTSFGVQSAVMLHLVTRVIPHLPVIFIDTGFHFQETYRFADELTQRLQLNLRVYAAAESPSWFVARHGQLWKSDNPDELDRYDQLRKVEPMNRALAELARPRLWRDCGGSRPITARPYVKSSSRAAEANATKSPRSWNGRPKTCTTI